MRTILVNKENQKLPFKLEIFQLTKVENGYSSELVKGVDSNTSLTLDDSNQISEKLGLIKVTILRRSKLSKLKEAKIRLFPNRNFFNFDKIKVERISGPNYASSEILNEEIIESKKDLLIILLFDYFEIDIKGQLDNLNDAYYFAIKSVDHKKMDIFVDTESRKCAKICYEYQDIDITEKDTKLYNINFLNHTLNTNLNNGVYTLKRPLVSLFGKALSCNLSINYNNNSLTEIIDDTFYTGLPNGWLFNYQQYLIGHSDQYYNDQYYYVNGDSQILKFKIVENNLYIEESGSGLILRIEDDNKIIQDLNNITYVFKDNYLVEINKGRYSLTINYETIENNKRRIYRITDSSNRQVNIEYTTNRIRIYGNHNHDILINIENDMIDSIYETDNFNPINNNSYYSYDEELLLSKIQTRGFIDEARISYFNNKLSKIEQYKIEQIEKTIQFAYQIEQNTNLESTTVSHIFNQSQSTVTHKYYFDDNRKFTRSVEIVNGKEYNEKLNQAVEEELFIELDKEEHLFANKIYESSDYINNGIENKIVILTDEKICDSKTIETRFYNIDNEPISTLSDSQNVEIQIISILSCAQLENYENIIRNPEEFPNSQEYFLKFSFEVKDPDHNNQYVTIITSQTLFSCISTNFLDGSIGEIIKNSAVHNFTILSAQNRILNRSREFRITLESKRVMAVDKLILNLVVKSKKYPIYYVDSKIASTTTDKIMLFDRGDYPKIDQLEEGYGLLEYPKKITYETNEGQIITLDNIKLTINDIFVNKNKYYSGIENIFYYNDLHNVITNYNSKKIYIENCGIKANPYYLSFTIANYIKNEDNTISKTFSMVDYNIKDNESLYVTQNVTIYNNDNEHPIDEDNEALYYSNNISIYDINLNIQEEITYYAKYGDLDGLLDTRKRYEYDEIGNVKNIYISTGKKISYTYDELGNVVESSTITYNYDEDTKIRNTYTYDKYGNLLSQTNPLQQTTSYLYSSYFKELVEVNQGNSQNVLSYQYNLLKSVKNKNQMTYTFIYDAKENLNIINYKTAKYTYLFEEYTKIFPTPNNALGIRSEETGYLIEYYNVNREAYSYDKYQNITSTYLFRPQLDGLEKTSDFIYGEEKLSDNSSIYDVEDRYDTRIIKHEASLLRKVYDYLENVKYIYRYNTDKILISIEKYQIDDEQKEANIITKKEFTYKNNKLESKTIEDVTYGEKQSILTKYQYNNDGLLKQETLNTKYNNEAITTYEYDEYHRINEVTTSYFTEKYTYENDHIATYKVNGKTYIPTYDKLDRIIKIEDENQLADTYIYNDLGYLIEEKNKDHSKIVYSYDNEANILSKTKYGTNNNIIHQTNYIYDTDDKNKLIQVVEDGTTININYEYNFNISSYRNLKLEYERGRLLKKVTKNENEIYQYYYRANGQRYKKTHNTTTTEYLYEEGKLLKELVLGVSTPLYEINYLYNEMKLFGFEYNGEVYKYEYDILGNIIGIYDDNNDLLAKYTYDAYGNHIVYNSDNQIETDESFIGNINKIRYKGYYYDVETGLYYCNSRYYSPELCRFISPDSIEYLDPSSINGLNLYAYCNNDPVNRFDPTGHDWEWSTFWTGLLMFGTAITAIALSVTTFGAGIPLTMSIVTGVTLGSGVLTGINGVATMIEAGTQYNFVRDGLFNDVLGLSDSVYNIYAGVTEGVAAFGSMILGFYHTTGQYKAAKASQQYLGKGYTKAGKNRWVSKDGYRQVRWDITHHMYKGKPSPVHFNWYEYKYPIVPGVRNKLVSDVHVWLKWFSYYM